MASKVVVQTVCDACDEVVEESIQYTIREGGRARTTDLCRRHALQIEGIMKRGYPTARKAKRAK